MNLQELIDAVEEAQRVNDRHAVYVSIEDYQWVAPQLEAMGIRYGWHPAVVEGQLIVVDMDAVEAQLSAPIIEPVVVAPLPAEPLFSPWLYGGFIAEGRPSQDWLTITGI